MTKPRDLTPIWLFNDQHSSFWELCHRSFWQMCTGVNVEPYFTQDVTQNLPDTCLYVIMHIFYLLTVQTWTKHFLQVWLLYNAKLSTCVSHHSVTHRDVTYWFVVCLFWSFDTGFTGIMLVAFDTTGGIFLNSFWISLLRRGGFSLISIPPSLIIARSLKYFSILYFWDAQPSLKFPQIWCICMFQGHVLGNSHLDEGNSNTLSDFKTKG